MREHYAGIPDLYLLAKKINIPFPEKVLILAVEVKDPFEIKQEFSDEIKSQISEIKKKIQKNIKNFLRV